MILLAVCGGVAVGVLRTLAGEPNEIRLEVVAEKTDLAPGEAVTVTITVENVDVDSVLITGVGLDQSLLDGFILATTDPAYRSIKARNYPLYGEWNEYRFNRQLQGGEKLTITLVLTAKDFGEYSGDVSVWVEYELAGWKISRARREKLDFVIGS